MIVTVRLRRRVFGGRGNFNKSMIIDTNCLNKLININ